MGYALFAQRKVVLTGNLNAVSLQQTQRSNEQYMLATDSLSLQQQMTSLQASQANVLAALYKKLSEVGSDVENPTDNDFNNFENERASINAQIQEQEQKNQAELDTINRKIYLVSVKENALEMQIKRLDTQISSLQKQLEAVEDAEGSAIDRATPKFNGVG